ncbi:MAG: TetR/AcrR family transcriptional regulator, partial [Acidimicrobiia bacterium]|nr:TetR/AcrR family transcriptional regulator [Acidimicrobiia bacterium]
MGRTKQYERAELLDRAIELFRLQGFNGTSTAELVAELGVNRKSMYAEFGSKQGLFEAALERYSREHLSRVLAPIEAPEAGADAIRDAFTGYASASTGWFAGRGCLMCNTAVERGALDPGSGRYVAAYLERLTRAFRHALSNAQHSGEIDQTADLDELAAFFTTALIGVAACIRAEAPPEQLHAASRVATSVLEAQRRG